MSIKPIRVLLFVGNLISSIIREPCGFTALMLMGYECVIPYKPRPCTQTSVGALQIQEDEDILVSTSLGESTLAQTEYPLNNVHG
jgi:hypothetical protein